jgi:excisionase family DNA binding protein
MTNKKFLTVKEVADHLVVHQRTIYRYIKAKKLKATNIGGWRIMVEDLQDFIKRSTNTHYAKRS